MKTLNKVLIAGGAALAVLVPVTVAAAAGGGPGNPPRGNGQECDYSERMDRIQARDGSGPRHTMMNANRAGNGNGNGYGPMDGTGAGMRAGR